MHYDKIRKPLLIFDYYKLREFSVALEVPLSWSHNSKFRKPATSLHNSRTNTERA